MADLSPAAARLLADVAEAVAADRPSWITFDTTTGLGRVTLWSADEHGEPARGATVLGPVLAEAADAGLLDIAPTAGPIGSAETTGRRVQPTTTGWAACRTVPAQVAARQMRTWRPLP